MARKSDLKRREQKVAAIVSRMNELRGNEDILIGMLDEIKLDLMILALGLGGVATDSAGETK